MEYSKTKVIGSALYFELEKQDVIDYGHGVQYGRTEVRQIVLLPYFTLDNSPIRIRTLERSVNYLSPRSRWRSYRTYGFSLSEGREKFEKAYEDITNDVTTGAPPYKEVTAEDAENFAITALEGFIRRDLFNYLFKGGWTLVGKPFAVELSEHDAGEVRKVVTPKSLIARVERVKKSLGYPDIARAREFSGRLILASTT